MEDIPIVLSLKQSTADAKNAICAIEVALLIPIPPSFKLKHACFHISSGKLSSSYWFKIEHKIFFCILPNDSHKSTVNLG